MAKALCRYLLFTCLALAASALQALSSDEALLLRKDFQLYQAWSLSRNYYFGTSLPRDRLSALAWQMVYVDLLPAGYPQKDQMLSFFLNGLSQEQVQQAKARSKQLIENYNLGAPFSEENLSKAYALRDETNNWQALQPEYVPYSAAGRFKNWIEWIADHIGREFAAMLDQKGYRLLTAHAFPIVYGQVAVKGPEAPEMVLANIPLSENGYFVAHADTATLHFQLAGYKPVAVNINPEQQIQAIPPVVLEPLPHSKKTGVVGRILPWNGFTQGNILLQADDGDPSPRDPWKRPAIPLTVTNTGQFYATGLAPGRYKLFINTAGLSTVVKFAAKEGEIRGLSIIDLRSKIYSRK
ncbi:hypothetical protein ACFORL_05245 [Legionella dresdenensis]|uniref:Carboxypeptidase regulatory-like domain-containing protein n=1 Tax=Legionella dresdenensis TaxID=450200 RepID=A0ABV8CDV6_9GAMM